MVGEVLRKLRVQNNLTQKQVAEIMKIDRSTYAYYESGRTVPDVYTISVLSRIYNITPGEMMTLCYGESAPSAERSQLKLNSDSKASNYGDLPQSLSELNRDEQLLVLYFRQIKDRDEALKFMKERCMNDLSKEKEDFLNNSDNSENE